MVLSGDELGKGVCQAVGKVIALEIERIGLAGMKRIQQIIVMTFSAKDADSCRYYSSLSH
jgi:hypothetical protein